MHDTAYDTGRMFFERYIGTRLAIVVELGAQNINGTLRDFGGPNVHYIGLDIEPGPGVDVCVSPSADLPFGDASVDFVIASSVFEHDALFWMTFIEMARILKPGGFLYISVPSNGAVHRYPQDCWRFYPDAGRALAGWSRRSGHRLNLVESFVLNRKADQWNDFCAIFLKSRRDGDDLNDIIETPTPIAIDLDACNVMLLGIPEVLNPSSETEDMRIIRGGLTNSNRQ